MKQTHSWFQLYPHHPQASNLSIAGGALRLLALLLAAGAAFYSLGLLLAGLHPLLHGGLGRSLLYLMDELDDELASAFFLWCGAALCWYASRVLRCKARMLAGEPQLPPPDRK